jgi:hypothetical protein
VFIHNDGTEYYAMAGDGIVIPSETEGHPMTALFPTMKAGTYTVRFQVKVDTVPAWTAAGTPLECAAVRQTKMIILETKR